MSDSPFTSYENIPSGYWEWHIVEEQINVSPLLKSMLGLAEDFDDSPIAWRTILAPQSRLSADHKIAAHFRTKKDVSFSHELEFIHQKTAQTIAIVFMGHLTKWNTEGKAALMTGSFIDFTSLKLREAELRRTKEFLDKTNETAKVGGWELNLVTGELIWSPVTRRIFGVSDDFAIYRGVGSEFLESESDKAILNTALQNAINFNIPYDLEFKITNKQGKRLWTRAVGQPEFVDGRCIKINGVFQDIDDRKQIEEAMRLQQEELQQATATKLEFLSIMSHEIRTPMNAVIGFTNLLLQNPRPDQMDYLNVLKFSAENLLTLINDILDYNKIDAGKIKFEASAFNLHDLLQHIKAAQQQEAEKKDLLVRVEIDPEIPKIIIGDQMRLGQVLTNLVANAIKFTAIGTVDLCVTLLKKSEQLVNLHFEVRDTGIGIEPDKLNYIFEKFAQASSETTRKYGGTGLGLAISKRLLELVGADLKVHSTPNLGSCFYFDLSFKTSGESSILTREPLNMETGFPGKRVLITEDNPINVMLVKKFLQQWHVRYDVAENGQIAVDKMSAGQYDLILMDLQMPEMDGYQATTIIRAIAGNSAAELPIIALTASAVEDLRERIMEAGMNDCLTKPFKPESLYELLDKYL